MAPTPVHKILAHAHTLANSVGFCLTLLLCDYVETSVQEV